VERTSEQLRLGQLLVRAGVLDTAALAKGLAEHDRSGRPLGQTLVELGLVSEATLVSTLAHQLGLPVASVATWPIDLELRELVPWELAEKHACLPLARKDEGGCRSVYLAMADPSDLEAVEAVRAATGREVRIVLVAPSELERALARVYRGVPIEPEDEPGESPPPRLPDEREFLHRWSVSPEEILALLREDPSGPDAPLAAGAPAAEGPGGSDDPASRSALDRRRLAELDAMLKLVMQLLVEAGVVSRDELVRRLSALAHEER
jgi:hypothetical protein